MYIYANNHIYVHIYTTKPRPFLREHLKFKWHLSSKIKVHALFFSGTLKLSFKQKKVRLQLALFSPQLIRVIAQICRDLGSAELSLAPPLGSQLTGLCLDINFRTISKDF